MTHLRFFLAFLGPCGLVALTLWLSVGSATSSISNNSESTESHKLSKIKATLFDLGHNRVCQEIRSYPRKSTDKLSFEIGEISPLCKPFVKGSRGTLDRCGDPADRFDEESTTTSSYTWPSRSSYTWPSHDEMLKKGRLNLFSDKSLEPEIPKLNLRIEEIRTQATNLCCGDDVACRAGMAGVEVSVCKPPTDGSISDPCVHGGAFEMAGRNYTSIFAAIQSRYTKDEDSEFRAITTKNLPLRMRGPTAAGEPLTAPLGGKIVLTSYVRKDLGVAGLEPTLFHEFGHACTMVKMQVQAQSGVTPEVRGKALNALKWFDGVKNRCAKDTSSQEAAYADFWESIGETRELAACFAKITDLNRKEVLDKPCNGICPGHYMEETVGVAFSLLTGDLTGRADSVFPNTCDHMRDRQHPMVADVMECLAQHSPRFRTRLIEAYGCESGPSPALASTREIQGASPQN